MYKLCLKFMYKCKLVEEVLYSQAAERDRIFFEASLLINNLRKCRLKAAERYNWNSYSLYVDVEDELKLSLFRMCNWDINQIFNFLKKK